MTAKKLIVASVLLVGATVGMTTATLAQGFYDASPYGYRHGRGLYNDYRVSPPDYLRGGPGPRVQDGGGMGIGAVR